MFKNLHKLIINKLTKKTTLILLLIILIGAFLRFHNFEELLRFNNDQVRDAQIVNEMRDGKIPLLGPKAGGTKFNLGPAFYYLEYLSGSIFGFSPSGIAFFIPILSTISIYLFYLLFKKIFSTNITLFLTFLYAISFYAIKYSHFAWNPNAIPFFLLSFFLLLIHIYKNKNNWLNFILLGIIIGISSQLHTTLLILMPASVIIVFIYSYFTTKNVPHNFVKTSLIALMFILINIPFIYGNLLDSGQNIKEFFSGINTKTSSEKSLFKNIINDSEFFLQGSSYYLTGIEPQKNWSNIIKLVKSKNPTEILLFISSLFLFLVGIYLFFIKKQLSKNNSEARITRLILITFTILAFCLFIFIGDELNIRFFIILLFLPYLILGILGEYINKKIVFPKIKIFIFSIFLVLMATLNLSIFLKTYNLNDYRAPKSAYGGISWGELGEICLSINKTLESNSRASRTAFIDSFEFKKSLFFACDKNNLILEEIPQNTDKHIDLFFVIVENENVKKNIEKYNSFKLHDSQKIKRFTVLVFNSQK